LLAGLQSSCWPPCNRGRLMRANTACQLPRDTCLYHACVIDQLFPQHTFRTGPSSMSIKQCQQTLPDSTPDFILLSIINRTYVGAHLHVSCLLSSAPQTRSCNHCTTKSSSSQTQRARSSACSPGRPSSRKPARLPPCRQN